ncbi:MAG TPA: amidohydrolase [Sedimentibacter sp.]|nr:amidohydrolase [Sedimentibacter sp.]
MNKKNFELGVQLRHELHEHPELSNKETWTKNHLINFLKKHTSLKIVDRGRWFYAVYEAGPGKKNIAFRADFDAIPMDEYLSIPHGSKVQGVSHKCGHDGHSASLAGFALEVDMYGADKNIFFLFQHAEETGDGAREAAVFIEENNIDEIYAYHNMSGFPYKAVTVKEGVSFCASKGMIIRMEGAPSHASMPEKGRNPAFAIAKIINSIPDLTSPDKNKGMVLCTVIQVAVGERAFGKSPGKGELLLTIRALYDEDLYRLQNSIEKLALEEGGKYGLDVSFEYVDVFPETYNHAEISDKIRRAAKKKGYELVEMKEAIRSSEDFGYYTKETKGAIFLIGNGEDYPALHTNEYDFRDELIEVASDIFAGILEC